MDFRKGHKFIKKRAWWPALNKRQSPAPTSRLYFWFCNPLTNPAHLGKKICEIPVNVCTNSPLSPGIQGPGHQLTSA